MDAGAPLLQSYHRPRTDPFIDLQQCFLYVLLMFSSILQFYTLHFNSYTLQFNPYTLQFRLDLLCLLISSNVLILFVVQFVTVLCLLDFLKTESRHLTKLRLGPFCKIAGGRVVSPLKCHHYLQTLICRTEKWENTLMLQPFWFQLYIGIVFKRCFFSSIIW